MATETTKVTQTSVSQAELDELLGTPGPGADNIMVPDEGKPNVFSRKQVDLSYLNEKDAAAPVAEKKKPEEAAPVAAKDIVDEVADTNPETTAAAAEKAKPKGDLAETIKSLIKAGKLIPFDDEKPIEEYTAKDIEELLDANYTERETKLRQQVPVEFFDSLPEELQVAAKYALDGGKDMKGLFRALGEVEEIQALDATDPKNYEKIVRQFLTTTNFGTPEEIDEEITGLRDRDELEKKAGQFKPKLEKMQEAILAQKLADQEQRQASQAAAAKQYVGSVYKTLEKGELNGVKLDRKTQEMIYAGLTHARYPSISGRPTNYLGHLLEKYQYVEPRHDLISEALWLLADPEGYKSKLREQGKNGATEKTVRMLRTEEANRTNSSTVVEKEEATTKRIPRNNGNFFKRS